MKFTYNLFFSTMVGYLFGLYHDNTEDRLVVCIAMVREIKITNKNKVENYGNELQHFGTLRNNLITKFAPHGIQLWPKIKDHSFFFQHLFLTLV